MISGKDTVEEALRKAKAKKVYIEGNFVKILPKSLPNDIKEYLAECKERDIKARRKRLEVTKQVQKQNKELEEAAVIKEALVLELQNEKDEAEKLRDEAVEDLDILQKRTQFELIGLIVKVALVIIIGVGAVTTLMYITALLANKDTTILGNAWSNLFGILLTNSFSIIGTIMGVKYATEKNE
jgi:hypothetical protein